MRICVNGFGEHADTLHVEMPKHADWRALTSVLSIGGVTYYYTQGCMMGIRYNGSVDPVNVAAQALIVAAGFCDTPVNELELVVKELGMNNTKTGEIARDVQGLMLTMSAPAKVPLARVMSRGSGPAYYLQSRRDARAASATTGWWKRR